MSERFFYRRADRRSAAVLLLLVAAGIAVMVYMGGGKTAATGSGGDSTVVAGVKKARFHRDKPQYYSVPERKPELFPFDPNTADSTAFLRLGLQPWQVRNIYKYRARGGVYRKPSDFARLYGLTVGQYRALKPFIRISPDFLPASALAGVDTVRRDTLRYPVKIGRTERVVLNRADTNMLRKVPGIGSYYARAIVRYGARLGGYVAVGQLDEIEDFPQDSKQYFIVDSTPARKMNLNSLTLSQLRRHPYINFYQAKAIVDYRRQHGRLGSLSDLRLCRDFTEADFARLEPYVEF